MPLINVCFLYFYNKIIWLYCAIKAHNDDSLLNAEQMNDPFIIQKRA